MSRKLFFKEFTGSQVFILLNFCNFFCQKLFQRTSLSCCFKRFTKSHIFQRCLIKFLNFSLHSHCRPWACNFIKKETLAQVFSCELCEISKNTFFTGHLWATTFCLEDELFTSHSLLLTFY